VDVKPFAMGKSKEWRTVDFTYSYDHLCAV
jgi:hypothetical protein